MVSVFDPNDILGKLEMVGNHLKKAENNFKFKDE